MMKYTFQPSIGQPQDLVGCIYLEKRVENPDDTEGYFADLSHHDFNLFFGGI